MGTERMTAEQTAAMLKLKGDMEQAWRNAELTRIAQQLRKPDTVQFGPISREALSWWHNHGAEA